MRTGHRGLVINKTIITVTLTPTGENFGVICEIVDCEGRWAHDGFVDARPIACVFGAILTRGVSTWLIPLLEGSDMRRDQQVDAILMRPRLERRARFALGADRVRDLPPLVGEFLVAHATGATGVLYAALWTSPLQPDEIAAGRLLLQDVRFERHHPARHGPPAVHVPHRLLGAR